MAGVRYMRLVIGPTDPCRSYAAARDQGLPGPPRAATHAPISSWPRGWACVTHVMSCSCVMHLQHIPLTCCPPNTARDRSPCSDVSLEDVPAHLPPECSVALHGSKHETMQRRRVTCDSRSVTCISVVPVSLELCRPRTFLNWKCSCRMPCDQRLSSGRTCGFCVD